MDNDEGVQLPVPISYICENYLLFDIEAIFYLRRHHNICGVFIGTLPQNPSQNVFMGLPMQIMPEEAQLLIDQGVAYMIDDARLHDEALAKANTERQKDYVGIIAAQSQGIAEEKAREKEIERRKAMKRVKLKQRDKSESTSDTPTENQRNGNKEDEDDPDPDDSLFTSANDSHPAPSQSRASSITPSAASQPPTTTISITPTTSHPLLPPQPPIHPKQSLATLTSPTYNLRTHLSTGPQTGSFFHTPGLRFGCQFCVYPGDPLRYHSHFLGVGVSWDEQIDLMDIVGGGRLGTGVKKGYLFGGKDPDRGEMRTWSVEWAGM